MFCPRMAVYGAFFDRFQARHGKDELSDIWERVEAMERRFTRLEKRVETTEEWIDDQ